MSTAMAALPRLLSLVPGPGVTLAVALYSGVAAAQGVPLDELPQTARSMAMGGGMFGAATSTTSLYANPAGMALTRLYHIDTSGLYDPTASRWSLGGAVVDSSRTVAAGVGYTYSSISDSPDGRRTHDARLAVAMPLTDGIALGVTARYMDITGTSTGNTGPGQAFSGFTLDAGLAVHPARWFSAGVTGFSLTNPDTTVTPLSVGGGLALMPVETLTLTADVIYDMHSYDHPHGRYSGGVEFLAGQVPLRAGYVFDDGRGTQAVTGGLGWIDQAFGIEAAVRQEIVGGHQTTMLLNLRYFYRLL